MTGPRRIATLIALIPALTTATAAAEEVDHPAYTSWARVPAGTRIVMRSRTESKASVLTTTTTTTLRAVLPDLARLEVRRVSDATGSVIESAPEEYLLRRPFPLFGGVKKEDVGKPPGAIARGEETLKVGDREFQAAWYDTNGVGDGGLKLTTRTWLCNDVPGRLLKSVVRIPDADTTVTVEMSELTVPEPPASAK